MYGKRKCPICRTIFTTDSRSAKYCSDKCRRKAAAIRSKRWKRANKSYIRQWRKSHPDYQKEYRARKARENQEAVCTNTKESNI